MRYLSTILILALLALPTWAIDVGMNGKFFTGVAYDFSRGWIGTDPAKTVVADGDPPYHYGLAADLAFSAIFDKGASATIIVRADNLDQESTFQYSLYRNPQGQYYLIGKSAEKKVNVELSQAYINWPGFLGFSNVLIGKYEVRLGDAGEYNLFKSGFYPTSYIGWFMPTGIMLERELWTDANTTIFAGIEGSDNAVVGLHTTYGSFAVSFCVESASYDVGHIFGDIFMEKMPPWWEYTYINRGRFSARGPFNDTSFGSTIHMGVEFRRQFGFGLDLFTLFAYHKFKDSDPENNDYTGGSIIQFYPELSIPLRHPLKMFAGAFVERYTFNDPTTHPFVNENTLAYTLFSEARLEFGEFGFFGFMFEFVDPDTKTTAVSHTVEPEETDFHYSLTPRLIIHPVSDVHLEAYFTYSLWDPAWDIAETVYDERRERLMGFKLRTEF